MRKIFLNSILLLCALIVGSSNTWAADPTITVNFESGSMPSGWTNSNFAIVSNPAQGSYAASTNGKQKSTLTYNSQISKVKSVSVEASRTSNNTNTTLYIDFSTKSDFSSDVTTHTCTNIPKGSWANNTLTLATPTAGYVRIRWDGTTATKFIDNIIITYVLPACVTPTFDVLEGEVTVGTEVTISSSTTGSTIYYTTDGTAPSTSSASGTAGEASATVVVNDDMTIKAIAVKEGMSNSEVASATYTIAKADNSISFEGDITSTDISLTGGSPVNSFDVGNITSAEHGTPTYSVKSSTNLTEGTEFTLNATTGVISFTQTYKGVIVITASVEATPTYKAASADLTINCSGDLRTPFYLFEDVEELSVGASITVEDGVNIITPGTITLVTSDADIASVDNTNKKFTAVAVGSCNITLNTAATTYYDEGSITFQLNVVDFAKLPFDYDGNGTGTLPTGLTVSETGTYGSSPKIKFDTSGDYVILKIGQAPGELKFTIKGNGSGDTPQSGTFEVQTSSDGTSYSNLDSYETLGDAEVKTYTNLNPSVRYIKWVYTTKSLGNVALGAINLTGCESVTIGSAGYNTYVTANNVCFPTGVTGSIATAKTTTTVTLTSKESVPASTPIVLKAPAGTYYLPIITTTPESVTGNLLLASDGSVVGDESTIYALGKKNEVVGFYPVKDGDYVPAGKAYLDISGSTAPSVIRIVDEENNATAIDNIVDIDEAVKFIQNGQLFIKRNGVVYDAMGHAIR